MALNEIVVAGVGGDGNWTSAVERIKGELNRNLPEEEDLIKLALITRMQFYSKSRFAFNLKSSFMLTEEDRVEYGQEDPPGSGTGFPVNIVEIDSVFVNPDAVTEGSNPAPVDRSWPMRRAQISDMRLYHNRPGTGTGLPFLYSFAPGQGNFYVWPRPNGAYRLQFDYVSALDIPRAQWQGGAWTFRDSRGDPIEEDYSTPWLEHAEELIRNGAKADLFANVFRNDEGAIMARGQEQAALSNLRKEKHRMLSTGQVTPHFAGRYGSGYGGVFGGGWWS